MIPKTRHDAAARLQQLVDAVDEGLQTVQALQAASSEAFATDGGEPDSVMVTLGGAARIRMRLPAAVFVKALSPEDLGQVIASTVRATQVAVSELRKASEQLDVAAAMGVTLAGVPPQIEGDVHVNGD